MSFVTAALGAVPPPTSDLQVKKYSSGWASYQSPASNEALRGLQAELNRFGAGLSVDGVIGASTVAAVSRVANIYSGGSGVYADIARNLAGIASGGAERVAVKGAYARYFVSVLADKYAAGYGPTREQVATAERESGSSSSGGGGYTPPVITPGQPIIAASPGIGEPNKAIMAAGAVIVGALIIKNLRKGKRGGARSTRRTTRRR